MCEIINIKAITDGRGSLVVLENPHEVPFEIKRVFYSYGMKNSDVRGGHAHYEMREVLMCVSGSCTIELDDANQKYTFELNKPFETLLVEPYHWRKMYNFSEDCILMAIASTNYCSDDYINNYDQFLDIYYRRR